MSSENEIIDQSGEISPESDTEQHQSESVSQQKAVAESQTDPENKAVAKPSDPANADLEPPGAIADTTSQPMQDAPQNANNVEETGDEEDGWDAWIGTSPDEEVVIDAPLQVAIADPDSETKPVPVVQNNPENKVEEESEGEQTEEETTAPDLVEKEAAEEEPNIQENAVIEGEEAVSQEPVRPKLPQTKKKRTPRRDGLSTQDVITYFAPCGRCGFFMSGYRAAYGGDDLETAVYESKSGWLNLTWGMITQDLVLKSFGSRIEMNDLHFDGCCSECRRAFIYKSSRSEKKPAIFRIEIKPRKRQ